MKMTNQRKTLLLRLFIIFLNKFENLQRSNAFDLSYISSELKMTHKWTHTTNAVTLPFVTKSRHSVPLIQLCISRVNHLLGSTRLEGKVAQGQTSTIYSFPIFLMQPFSPETNGLLPKIYLKIQRRLDLINGSTFRFI